MPASATNPTPPAAAGVTRSLDRTDTDSADRGTRHDRWKRPFDVALALLALGPAAVVGIPVAVWIWLEDRGPIFYFQRRTGLGGRTFELVKFRTMRHRSDVDPSFTADGDDRISTIGRLLRPTHIDELPQLWNVLRGDMSIVGPRPEQAVFASRFAETIERYPERHRVRPGITGWAQVRQGYVDDAQGTLVKLRYDLEYLERCSPLFDLWILALTVPSLLFSGRGR